MKKFILILLFSSFIYANQYDKEDIFLKDLDNKWEKLEKEFENISKRSTFKDYIFSKYKNKNEIPSSNQFKIESEYDINLQQIKETIPGHSKKVVQIFPMVDENIYVSFVGCCDGNGYDQYWLVSIAPDGQFQIFLADPHTAWLSQTVEPLSKTPASLSYRIENSYHCWYISAQGFSLNCIYMWPVGTEGGIKPMEIAFDKFGNIYILAIQYFRISKQYKYYLWKYAPGEDIWLDPNNSHSLIPGGLNGIAYELYISGDGSIYYLLYPSYGSPDYSNIAANCDGAIYYSDYYNKLIGYFSDNRNFEYYFDSNIKDLKLNEYGEIFLLGYDKIHIVMADELPQGWYTCQLCKYPGENDISTRAKGPNCEPGKGEIILKLDRDQGSSDDSLITLDKSNTSASILFGERPKISAYWKDKNAQESPLSVKWELTGKTVTGTISDKSLFKNTPVLLFTGGQSPYNSQFLDFQTVHTGEMNLKVTSTTQDKEGTLEVEININLPNNLGDLYNNFDTEIIDYANAFGIPPQYLKAHVNKEAKKENGQFIPDSFRYEPLSYDIGTKGSTIGGFLKGIWSWTRSDWAKHYADYDSFHYPNGSLLTYEIINKINNFYKITEITPNTSNPDMPTYHCSKYWDLPTETPAITDIYNGNNGWADGSYPNILYNSNGPCSGERQNWDTKTLGSSYYMAYHNSRYYCTPENIPEICGPVRCGFIEWFYNHPFTVPQVPIASTYGLMQIWYITAVEKFKWNRGMDSSMREPSRLLDLHVNLNLGSSIDADYFGQKGIESSIDFDSFNNSIKEGLANYNKGQGYGDSVLSTVNLFKPKN